MSGGPIDGRLSSVRETRKTDYEYNKKNIG